MIYLLKGTFASSEISAVNIDTTPFTTENPLSGTDDVTADSVVNDTEENATQSTLTTTRRQPPPPMPMDPKIQCMIYWSTVKKATNEVINCKCFDICKTNAAERAVKVISDRFYSRLLEFSIVAGVYGLMFIVGFSGRFCCLFQPFLYMFKN